MARQTDLVCPPCFASFQRKAKRYRHRSPHQGRPDGYTLLPGSNGPSTVTIFLKANLRHEPLKDLLPAGLISRIPRVIAVLEASTLRSFAALIERAKGWPSEPAASSTAMGSVTHMTPGLLTAASGVRLNRALYQSRATAATNPVGGSFNKALIEFSTVLSLAQKNKIRLLASASSRRPALAPDTPTMIESGMLDVTKASHNGRLIPPGTPSDVVAVLGRALWAALPAPAAHDRMLQIGPEVADQGGAERESFRDSIRSENARPSRAVEWAWLKLK